jgi:hypothetical protein
MITWKKITDEVIGKVMFQNFTQTPAPSTSAAS